MDNNNQASRSNKKTWYRANRSLLIMLLVIFVLFVFFSLPRICSYARNYILAWKSPYKVVDSGMWVAPGLSSKIFWLDNNRVFFNSNDKLVPFGGPERGMIWDMSTGKATLSHPLGEWGGVSCVRDGKVFYSLRDRKTRKVTHYLGPIESAPEYPPPGENMRVEDRFNCDWAPKETIQYGKVPYHHKLRAENYLEVLEAEREGKSKGRMVYHERNGDKGTEMPFNIDSNMFEARYKIIYNSFLDVYVATSQCIGSKARLVTGLNRKHSIVDYYWIIERNGTFTRKFYPESMPTQILRGLYPFRQGYVIHGGGGRSITASDSGAAGLYLMEGQNYGLLVGGWIESVGISPDGCKVAFVHARNYQESVSRKRPYRTLKMMNLCK